MDQVSPAVNLSIQKVESCSWDGSSPCQPSTPTGTCQSLYSNDNTHSIVNVEAGDSDGSPLCNSISLVKTEEDPAKTQCGASNEDSQAGACFDSERNSHTPTSQGRDGQQDVIPMPLIPSVSPGIKDPNVHISLEGAELWRQFFQVGTEMIITRTGRRMFPGITVIVCGLEPDAKYTMTLEINPADNHRYKFINAKWVVVGKAEAHCEDMLNYVHPDSPATGRHWMSSKVSFKKIKVTNNRSNKRGQVCLNSMQRYLPRVVISKCTSKKSSVVVHTEDLPECCFIAVTAYQNDQVTQLKIDHNPFAKAFRDSTGEPDMYGYSTWPPMSPLLSPYASSIPGDMQLAMHQAMPSPSSILPAAGPSPLPQFNAAFGNWDSPPYSPATFKPPVPSAGALAPHPALSEPHRYNMMWNVPRFTHCQDSPPISPLVYPPNSYAAAALNSQVTTNPLNPSVYNFPNIASMSVSHQDGLKSPSLLSSRFPPLTKNHTSSSAYQVSGSPVGYGPGPAFSVSKTQSTGTLTGNTIHFPQTHNSAFVSPKLESGSLNL